MYALPRPLFQEVRNALCEAGRDDLIARLDAYEGKADAITTGQAASLLGVSSPNTVKNWLEAGHFPGAFKTAGGHWRFLRSEVEEVKERMNAIRERNRRNDLAPDDTEDSSPQPLL